MGRSISAGGRRLATSVGRRGILAACVAAAAAITDRFGDHGTALATDNAPLVVGQTNLATIQTSLAKTSGGAGVAFYLLDQTGTAASFGIRGEATGAGVGVYGLTDSGIGVKGVANTTGTGAFLDSNSGVGFQGRSVTGIGVVGSTNNSVVLSEGQAPLTAYAGQFIGGHGVYINGDLQVTGIKSAVVPLAKDGTQRRVYCMESPEAFFEDFGEGKLAGGVATVSLNNDFAQIVHTDHYHVFLTPYGDCKGLYVSGRTPSEFQVREVGGGTSNLMFSYRIVASRGDTPRIRMQVAHPPNQPKMPPTPNFNQIDDVRRRVTGGR